MKSHIFSTDKENCHKTLVYQLIVTSTYDNSLEGVYTWIGKEEEDVFSHALYKMCDIIHSVNGEEVNEKMYAKYEHLYDIGNEIYVYKPSFISGIGYKFEIICTFPDYVEKY